MKSNLLILTCLLLSSMFAAHAQTLGQRSGVEDTIIHRGEALNPAYLEKKRELDQVRKQKEDVDELLKREYSGAGLDYSSHLGRRISTLEFELSKLPMYLPSGKVPSSSHAEVELPAKDSGESGSSHAESRIVPPPIAGEGTVTFVYHSYSSAKYLTPEPVEAAGGIRAYGWVLYPRSYFDKYREAKAKANQYHSGAEVAVISTGGYQLCGVPEDATMAWQALDNGEAVSCSLLRPAAVTMKVPTGEYYLDYWLVLQGRTAWGNSDRIGPRSIRRQNNQKWGPSDWGPLELRVVPNSETRINITPQGDNIETRFVGLGGEEGVMNLVNYGDRLGP